VVKLDKNGQIIWQKAYGGFEDDYADSIQQTSDGGYIVSGTSFLYRIQKGYLWVLKLKSDGVVEWQKCYGGNKGESSGPIQQTTDGGYVVAGTTHSFGTGSGDIWVLKLRNDGAIIWQKTYGGKRYHKVTDIQQIPEGYIMVGSVLDRELKGTDKVWVLKIDKDGLIPSIPSLGIDTKVIPQEAKYFSAENPPWESEMKGRRYYTYRDNTHVFSRDTDAIAIIKDTDVKPVDTRAIIQNWDFGNPKNPGDALPDSKK